MSTPALIAAAPKRAPIVLTVAVLLALTGLAAWGASVALTPSAPPLPVLGQLPAFALTDQSGKPSGLAELSGKVWVADFVFTRCPTVCPLLTERMGQLEQRSAALGERFQLVSISVDPAYDSPEVLTRYMAKHHVDAARWRFLTGPNDAIAQVVTSGFKEVLERDAAKGPDDFLSIVHGGHFVLVDGRGQIRGYYDSTEPAALEQVLVDAKSLLRER